MSLPTYIFGFIVSSLYGVVFHFIRGGGGGRLVLYLLLSWLGFWGGHFIAEWMNWNFMEFGPLNLGFATLGSLLALGLGYWLSLTGPEKETDQGRASKTRKEPK